MQAANTYPASKPRYEVLDGLRGVAAMMVVMFHLFESYTPLTEQKYVNHGYLAVDFFFVLSGFVIGYAYDDRWGDMTVRGFFKRRLTRLHPMAVAGVLLGACVFYPSAPGSPLVLESPLWKVALCLVMGLLLLPCGKSLDIRGWGATSSFNAPIWTLSMEYLGNILYALVLRHLPKAALALLCAGCAFFTLDLSLGWDVFGLFPEGPRYSVAGGWTLDPQGVYMAFARLLFPFLCGLLIARVMAGRAATCGSSAAGVPEAACGHAAVDGALLPGSPVRFRYGFLLASLLLVAIFATPCIGGGACLANGIYQASAILLLFPLLVMLGAGSTTRTAVGAKVCRWLGDISYPLYVTHYPLVYLQISWLEDHSDAPLYAHALVMAGVAVTAVLLSWCLLKFYDRPVRRWLTDHWCGGQSAKKIVSSRTLQEP